MTAQNFSQKDLEREVVKVNPKESVREQIKPVAQGRLEFKCGVSEKLEKAILRAQDVVSNKLKRAASLEETLHAMTEHYLERQDPVRKAARQSDKKAAAQGLSVREPIARRPCSNFNLNSDLSLNSNLNLNTKQTSPISLPAGASFKQSYLGPMHTPHPLRGPRRPRREPAGARGRKLCTHSPTSQKLSSRTELASARYFTAKRTAIPASVQRQVRQRDEGKCIRCGTSRWVDFHHMIPLSLGGVHTAENIVTLCRAHHRMVHEALPPIGKIKRREHALIQLSNR